MKTFAKFLKFIKTNPLAWIAAIAILSRWIPHPPNLTAMGGFALFVGLSNFSLRNKLFTTLGVLGLSELVLGFHAASWAVWLGFVAMSLLGEVSGKHWKPSLLRNLSTSFLGSLVFFAISNLGVWIGFYPKTAEGFYTCYLLAVPFLKNSLLSDFVFSSIFLAVMQKGTTEKAQEFALQKLNK